MKRCDELERKLRFFNIEIDKFKLETTPAASNIDTFLDTNVGTTKKTGDSSGGSAYIKVLEDELEIYDKQLRELNSYNEKLTNEFNEKVEYQEVLEKCAEFYKFDNNTDGDLKKLDIMKFNSISGVVSTEERYRFERMIFRTTRGNSLIRFSEIGNPIVDPENGVSSSKSVFLIFYKSSTIDLKLKKICDAFQAHRYTLPPNMDIDNGNMASNNVAIKLMYENKLELIDSRTVLLKNRDTRYKLCCKLASNIEKWTWMTLKEKAIYHTLNQCKADVSGMLRGEGWVISENMIDTINAVNKAHANMDMAMPSLVQQLKQPWPTPPTHFITNKFTYGYQEFVNTYGIPRYREANPALFTAATFPFLFGVMYGDMGHGLFLLLTGMNLCWNEKKIENAPGKTDELTSGLFMGRYLILMMGFFAVYAGVIYNDCFSLGINFFGTRYEFDGMDTLSTEVGDMAYLKPVGSDESSVYPFGLDPIWHVASNQLLFFNSFKMKLSVVFGITQMFMGTCLKGINAIYFNEKLDLFFEVIPMMIFSSSLFLYMVLLIFMKWSIDWNYRMSLATCYDPTGDEWLSDWTMCDTSTSDDSNGMCTPWGYACTSSGDTTADKCPFDYGGSGDGCQPPNLITSLINIALSPGTVDEPMYKGQAPIQNILLFAAVASVPVLLIAKPYFISQQVHEAPQSVVVASTDDDEEEGQHGEHEEVEEHDFGEIVIHQAIETIEFVLGMVSNTASYLRLWALSLAHSELAGVFWGKCMLSTLSINWFATYLGFGLFAGITLSVLLMMDVLECFLHALRLHWVEFQNKFFKADGIRFAPYSFKQIIIDSSAS